MVNHRLITSSCSSTIQPNCKSVNSKTLVYILQSYKIYILQQYR